jgi:16S rRNA A1518/A1519 N6-dimethyltransferase RsmA/KsgA/DIM1 with predicted DNA glycosylase/AP lyase activity
MGRSFGRAAVARPGAGDYNRVSLNVQSRYAVTMVATIVPEGFHPPARTPACLLHLVPRRPRPGLETAVDDAFSRRGGIRVKDLLRQLRNNHAALGSLPRRHEVVAAVRASPTTRRIHQRRLQELRSADLSLFMAELLHADATNQAGSINQADATNQADAS